MSSRLRRVACVVALSAALVVGVGSSSAGDLGQRTVDCGRLDIPAAAGLSPFRAWAKGVSCSSGRTLLGSAAVAHGLGTGAFNLFRANGFECASDPFTLVCWVGRVSGKRLGVDAYHLAAARSPKVVLAALLGERVTAHTYREAAVKVIRARAGREGKTTSPSVNAWKGGCELSGDALLPGVRTWSCILFDSKKRSECTDQIWLYRSGPAARNDPAAGWRWDSLIGQTPPYCR